MPQQIDRDICQMLCGRGRQSKAIVAQCMINTQSHIRLIDGTRAHSYFLTVGTKNWIYPHSRLGT